MSRGALPLLLVLAACARADAPVSLAGPPPALPPPSTEATPLPVPVLPALPLPSGATANVRLAHASGDTWIVDYALPEPVVALAFRRRSVARETWRVLDPPDATLVDRFVVSPRPFGRLRIQLTTSTVQPEKGYRPFYRYADRGVLAFTGQLDVAHASCSAGDCAGNAGSGLSAGVGYAGSLVLLPASGESVVVRGRSPAPEASVPLGDDGTYAYFGTLAPVETPDFVGVLDQGMPAWMRARVAADLPRLFAFYAGRLGALDAPKPAVFLTFAPRDHGMSIGGGVLKPHLVTLDVELDEAQAVENPATLLHVDRLVAHEAAHFWNADQHTRTGDPAEAWLDEGAADAMAMRALHAAGVLDDEALRGALSEAASECALWLSAGEPLTSSARPGHARAFYVCGSTLSLVAEAATRRHDPTADLFGFWRAVFDEGKPSYDEATFLRVLGRLGGNSALTEAVRRLLHEPQTEPTGALRNVLRLAGVPTSVVTAGPLPEDYEQHASIPATAALFPDACARALTFDGDLAVRPGVGVDGACPGLARGDVLDTVAGAPFGLRGATAFLRAYSACREHHEVEVTTAKRARVMLPCQPRMRSAPAYFEVKAGPSR